jgi:hypothetical protein
MKNDSFIHLKSKKFAIRIINTFKYLQTEKKASKQIVHCFKGS